MKNAKGLFFVLAIFAITACTSNASEFPIGEYKDAGNYIHTFLVDGTQTLQDPNENYVFKNGSYEVEGETLTVIDGSFPCGETEGVYKWSVDADGVLQLEVIEDNCVARSGTLAKGMTPIR